MLHYIFNKHKTICFASFVALSFSALEHIRKYPASFIKRQEHTQMLNGKDRVFSILWPKQWIKTKEDLHVESTDKCKIRLFAWKTLLLVFQTWVYCQCLLLIFSVCSTSFYLWDHRNWLTGEYTVWWVYHSNLGWSPKKRTIRFRIVRKNLTLCLMYRSSWSAWDSNPRPIH